MSEQKPTDNPGWYRGDGGQWRLDPVRRPKWDREGIHAIAGMFTAGLLALGIVSGAVIFFIGFLAYEITEGWRIRDWAYRDIGGYLIGLAIGLSVMAAFEVWAWINAGLPGPWIGS